ncbi:MAG: hypothetical protein JSV97_09115 [candidate division WOR-3 bacterium]|nr:MAG: hypothetical protein JSV97_09115 [candidate division WOR-3 bacterium]
MPTQIFPYANIIVGILVFIAGFLFHWLGQLISIVDWDFATKIGLQDKKALPEYKVYEHGIAVADVMIGWIYGIAAVGLILNTAWAYKLAWFPGVIMIYHSFSFWFWIGNQNKSGHPTTSSTVRIVWFLGNFITGVLTVLVAWNAN